MQEDTIPRQAMPLVTLRIISGLSRRDEQTSKDSILPILLLRLEPVPVLNFFLHFYGLENSLEILQTWVCFFFFTRWTKTCIWFTSTSPLLRKSTLLRSQLEIINLKKKTKEKHVHLSVLYTCSILQLLLYRNSSTDTDERISLTVSELFKFAWCV